MNDEKDKVVEDFIDDLGNNIREMTASLLGLGRNPVSVIALARNLLKIFDVTEEKTSGLFPPSEPVACKKGCAFCCYLLLLADAPTIFLIADEIEHNHPAGAVEELKARLKAFKEANYGLDMVPRPPCPLLVDDLCMAYEARPLVCRAQNSLAVSLCEEKYLGKRQLVVAHDIPLKIWTAISDGLAKGMAEAELAGDHNLEFSSALSAALETPAAIQRWLRGDAIFESVIRDVAGGAAPVH